MKSTPKVYRLNAFDDPLSEYLAWLMDSSIQIGPVSIGLDGLIGLIPGLGDVASNLVSALIIIRAMQNGVHRAAILRMVLNLGIDTVLGFVPVAGDVFDFAYKANLRNVQIYREAMSGTRKPARDWAFIAMVVLLLLALVTLPILGLFYLVQTLLRHW